MKQFSNILYISIIALLFLNSCNTLDDVTAVNDGETVTVKFNINVAAETGGTRDAVTRSVQDEDGSGNDLATIHDLRVIQFLGKGDDAVRIGTEQYLSSSDITKTNGNYSFTTELVASKTEECTLVFLANTCTQKEQFISSEGMTLGELKNAYTYADTQAKIFGVNGTIDDTKTFPDDGDYHMRLNGAIVTRVDADTPVSCSLARCAARIDVALKVKQAAGITVTGISLCSVPTSSYYFTSRTDIAAPYPENMDTQYTTYNNPVITSSPTGGSGTDFSAGYRFYMAPNMRGTVTNDVEMRKNLLAPQHATYLHIEAHYTDSKGKVVPMGYEFYLGGNLKDDYNICPNTRYLYNINIDERGNAKLDARVKEWDTVDFTTTSEDANCYILNPPTNVGTTRKFRIPIRRSDTFWGNHGYENVTNYVIGAQSSWYVTILWEKGIRYKDISKWYITPATINITKSTGAGIGSDGYFEVEIPEGIEGNMIIGLKKKMQDLSDSPILWSWHLWITDYNPDEIEDFNIQPESGRYIYQVTDGAVHRYDGDVWTTGKMANAFIMDRNLGAYDDTYSGRGFPYKENGCEGLFYQYGRKDPKCNDSSISTSSSTVAYKVNNPMIQNNVTSESAYLYYNQNTSKRSRWYDPTIAEDDEDWSKKSLFDPSPLGWVLPAYDIWNDFKRWNYNVTTPTHITTNISTINQFSISGTKTTRGFPSYSASKGMFYWPDDGNDVDVTKNRIFYPSTGYHRGEYFFEYLGGIPIRTFNTMAKGNFNIYYSYYDGADGGLYNENALAPVRCVRFRK